MKLDIVRAWKDEAYRQSLSDEQLRVLPAHPAGELDLTDADLLSVSGGWSQGCWSRVEDIHTCAFICNNAVHSIQNVGNNSNSLINISDICIDLSGL